MAQIPFSEEEERKRKKSTGVLLSDVNPRKEEEGIRESSFLEIPGARELKGKIKQHVGEMKFPGAKLAAEAADLVVPESLTEMAAPLKRGVSAAISKMSGSVPKYEKVVTKTGSYMKKVGDAPKAAAKDGPDLDYSEINAIKRTPESGYKVSKGNYMEDSTVEKVNPAEAEKRRQESLARMRKK